ncbi:unnamed protein product [Meganyctiphanes norvegica]|uniref:Uncharacterized protein n=1 Tax=Meganyctiphanes norvegica TaxID=48144 RepID=A0AAV2QA36_MEGNR
MVVQQVLGEQRAVTAPSHTPENDPMLQKLPPPKATEYVAAFSSRPRIVRTPPSSAAVERELSRASDTRPISGTVRVMSGPDAEIWTMREAEEQPVQRHSRASLRSTAPTEPAHTTPRSVLPPISRTNHFYTRTPL